MQIGQGKQEINNTQNFYGTNHFALSDLLTDLFHLNVVCLPRHHAMRTNGADIRFPLHDGGHYTPREGPRYPLHKRLVNAEGNSDVSVYGS